MFSAQEYKKIWSSLVHTFGEKSIAAKKNGRRIKSEEEIVEALRLGGEDISFSVRQTLSDDKIKGDALNSELTIFLKKRAKFDAASRVRIDEVI